MNPDNPPAAARRQDPPSPGTAAIETSIAAGARRLGWSLSSDRAAQLAVSAEPTLARFADVESRIDFDSDPLAYTTVRDAVRQPDTD